MQIATVRRHWKRGVAFATLTLNIQTCQLEVVYREWTEAGVKISTIVPECTQNWLWHFVRSQTLLQPDSYYILKPASGAWNEVIQDMVLRDREREYRVSQMNTPRLSGSRIADAAFDWSIDYKPWNEHLDYREYARHGFAQGVKWTVQRLGTKLRG